MVALLPLLATGGALVGGIQGFRRSGGNLGSALLGAGTGALTASGAGGLGRFAGSKLLGAVLPGGITGLGGQALLKAAAGGSLPAQALLKLPAVAGAGVGAEHQYYQEILEYLKAQEVELQEDQLLQDLQV